MKKINKQQIDKLKASDIKDTLSITGGSMEGELNVLPPINLLNPATKQYVDNYIGNINELLDLLNGEVV